MSRAGDRIQASCRWRASMQDQKTQLPGNKAEISVPRRTLLKGAATLAGGSAGLALFAENAAAAKAKNSGPTERAASAPIIVASDSSAVAETDLRQGSRLHPERHLHIQRHSLRRTDRRRKPLFAANETEAMDGRSQFAVLRPGLPARSARRLGGGRERVHVRVG